MSKYLILIALFCLSFDGLIAQNQQQTMKISSLQEACDYALKNNPDQKIYQLNIEKARTDFQTSESSLLPTIGGSFAGQINTKLPTTVVPGEIFGKPGQSMNVQFGQKYNYNAGISASKNVLDWQNRIQIKMAKNDMLTSDLQADAYQQNLKQQVALYYYSAIISQEALRTYQQNFTLADSTVALINQKLHQGLINSITANQSVISRNNVQQQILNTETFLHQCKNSLKILLGIDVNTGLVIDSLDLKNQPLLQANQNLGKDKNLAIQENQLKKSEFKVSFQKSAFVPKISWDAYYGQQQFRNDFGMSFNKNDWHPISYIGLNLQVPIFTGFANHNKLGSSKIDYQKSQDQWEESNRKANLNDELLLYEFSQSLQMLNPASSNYQLYEQSRLLASQQLKEGLISMDAYFKIFEDYLNAENAYLNALSSVYTYYSTIISRQ